MQTNVLVQEAGQTMSELCQKVKARECRVLVQLDVNCDGGG
jgi:hypothetical protein